MNMLLYVPGILFLLVILFRVVLPLIKEPRWKRLIDSARYQRNKENPKKSDDLLAKAVSSAPERPEPVMEYYLNYSDPGDLQHRFKVLHEGWKRTGDTPLAFMVGSAYVEEGELETAEHILGEAKVLDYMRKRRVFVYVHLLRELGKLDDAEKAYFTVLGHTRMNKEQTLDEQTALDLCPYLFLLKSRGEDPSPVMERIPLTSVRSDMGWADLQLQFQEMKEASRLARTGIHGPAEAFNRRREAFLEDHLNLIKAHISRVKAP